MVAKPHDIFLSYRRSDAETFAYLLYSDLTRRGYSLFYDHQTLGAGDFVQNICDQLSQCTDYVILLSNDALSERIFDPNDVLHLELAEAIRTQRNIVGIFLPGFKGFPERLPADIEEIRTINCLTAQMEYYDAMVDRLTSGQFLDSTPEHRDASELSVVPEDAFESKREALSWFRHLPSQERRDYMRLVLQLANDFNSSTEMMRLYNYLDRCDRMRGLAEPPAYEGVIPTDIVTYLNFFENLYLLLVTDTIHLPIIDDTYRFRFLTACNSPFVQESELLELGYQYPNIMALYDLWREYLRKENETEIETPIGSISDVIYSFDHDLHIASREYALAHNPGTPVSISFINRCFHKRTLTLRLLRPNDLDASLSLQQAVANAIVDNDEKNIFEAVTEAEMRHSLEQDICIGYFDGTRLVGQVNFVANPTPEQDLLYSVRAEVDPNITYASVIDLNVVDVAYRGFGLQRSMINLAKFLGRRFDSPALIATVSPLNPASARNFVKEGFRIVKRVPKYHSERDIYLYPLTGSTG